MKQILTINPAELVIAANVRSEVKIEKEFIESVKAHGVLQPPSVVARTDGTFEVVIGQRRTLAAVEAGLKAIDVMIVSSKAATDMVLAEQITENQVRQQLTTADLARGVKQMALFGVKASDIAKRTGIKSKEIASVIKVTESEQAMNVVEHYQADFDLAFKIAEFSDVPEAVEAFELEMKEKRPNLTWAANMATRIAKDTRAKAEWMQEITSHIEAGKPVEIREHDNWGTPKGYLRISQVFLDPERKVNATVELLLARKAPLMTWFHDTSAHFAVPVPLAEGLFADQYWIDQALQKSGAKGELSEEEKARRKAQRERSKDWRLSAEIRLNWLKETLFQRPKFPADWAQFVAWQIHWDNNSNGVTPTGYKIACDLLGHEYEGDSYSRSSEFDRLLSGTDIKPVAAEWWLLARGIAAIEGTSYWIKEGHGFTHESSKFYFRFLQGWGYELTPVELSVLEAKEEN